MHESFSSGCLFDNGEKERRARWGLKVWAPGTGPSSWCETERRREGNQVPQDALHVVSFLFIETCKGETTDFWSRLNLKTALVCGCSRMVVFLCFEKELSAESLCLPPHWLPKRSHTSLCCFALCSHHTAPPISLVCSWQSTNSPFWPNLPWSIIFPKGDATDVRVWFILRLRFNIHIFSLWKLKAVVFYLLYLRNLTSNNRWLRDGSTWWQVTKERWRENKYAKKHDVR